MRITVDLEDKKLRAMLKLAKQEKKSPAVVRALDEFIENRERLGFATRVAVLPAHWDMASDAGALLKGKGLNMPAPDVLLAPVASNGNFPLLARDAHFTTIRDKALPKLKLFPVP